MTTAEGITLPETAGGPLAWPVPAGQVKGLLRRDGFAVVTGHLRHEADAIDWSKYAAVDTLIILMGVRTRAHIARELIRHGRPASQAVAFVERGATPDERVVITTLGEVAEGLVEVENPAVFVAGEVVRLRPFLKAVIEASAVIAQES